MHSIIVKISATEIKKQLKEVGVKTIRCQQNGAGIILTTELSSKDAAIEFLKANNISLSVLTFGKISEGKNSKEVMYADFPVLYKHKII